MMRLNSIRARMTAAFSLAIAALLLFACGGLIWNARRTAERHADDLLNSSARKVRGELKAGEPRAALAELLEEERDLSSDNLALMIVDSQGRVVQKSQNRVPAWPHTPQDGWRIVMFPLGANTVVIGLPWTQTAAALQSQAFVLVALSLIVFVAASLGAWLLVGRTLSPLPRLSRQAQAASADSLRVRLHPSSQDAEIVELVQTLNGLLTRLTEAAAARGRFYTAASHELRTPLQALSGHLELALLRPRTEAEYLAVVTEAHAQTQRLISLVRDLLLLNRLDATPAPPQEPVSLAEICERALCQFAPLAEQRGLRIETALLAQTEIIAAPTHAEMLVRNLLENAMKYAATGGRVSARMVVRPDATQLEIFNECAPVPDWDEHKLFEPFYRPDASRNSKTGGNGLGLAICKAIADANGWQLTLCQTLEGVAAKVVFA